MRNFKIFVITALMLAAAGMALYWLSGVLPSSNGPDEEDFDEIYNEHDDQPDTDELFDQTPKQLEGTIKPLGISIYQEGTHRLEKDDQLVALLESDTIVLEDFEESEVTVTGPVRDTVEGGQVIMTVTLLEEEKPSGIASFNDVSYEFSFDFPAEWEVKKERDKATFTMSNEEGEDENLVIVYQYPNTEGSLEAWLADRDQNLFFQESQVKVGEGVGIRRTITNGDQEIIKTYAKAGQMAYEIRLVAQDEAIKNQYFSITDTFVTAFALDEETADADAEVTETDTATEENSVSDEEESNTAAEEPETDGDESIEEEEGTEDTTKEEEVPEEELNADENTEELEESTASEESEESYVDVEPLTADQVTRVIDKGLTPFEGRNLNFSYPSPWYFSYISDEGAYGFTDETSYKANDEEVALSNSRILLIIGNSAVECSSSIEKTLDSTTYTVCAREPGLSDLAKSIADTVQKPVVEE